MFRQLVGLTMVTFMFYGGSLVMAQEPPKKEAKPPVEDTATVGKMAGEGTKAPVKNDMAPPVITRKGPYTCDVMIDNGTEWYIHRIYIDDAYWGSVGRYGDAIARDVDTGRTKVYAEADFTDGSTRHWGPRWFDCNRHSTYTWTLRQ